MMCYRDQAYCTGPCLATGCLRLATPAVAAAADRSGLPLALMDLRAECSRYVAPAPSESAAGKER